MIFAERCTKHRLILGSVAAVVVAVAAVPLASGGAPQAAAEAPLALRAKLSMHGNLGSCPPGYERASLCASREGAGTAPGLGRVSETYTYPILQDPPGCAGFFAILPYTVRLAVAGRGELTLSVPGSTETCMASALNPTYPAGAIIGGTGLYAGASGTVTLEQHARYTTDGGSGGTDTWVGTISVPGHSFDVTPPRLSGTVGRTLRIRKRAKWTQVTYRVTASDDVDGSVPASCRPRSGSRFKLGRTVVTCSATDTSANTATTKFRITVKPRR